MGILNVERRTIYLFLAISVLCIISLFPGPPGLSLQGKRSLGILAFVIILWVTEALPLGLSALFGAMLLPILGIVEPSRSFAGFGNTAIFFLAGALSLGIAFQKTNLHKRIALILIRKWGKSSSSIMLSVILLGGFMSMTMPEHAVAAILLPVLMGIVRTGRMDRGSNFGKALFLALTYSTSVGSIGTLLGGARNVLALGILRDTLGISLSFLEWAVAGVPVAISLMAVTYIVLRFVYPWGEIDSQKIKKKLESEMSEIGEVSLDEKKAASIFLITFILWITVGTTVGLATVAVGGLILLILTRTLSWVDVERNMAWDLLFFYGGALTISHALLETGAMDFVAKAFLTMMGDHPLVIIISLFALVILVSNFMSNSAATLVILPIALTTITSLGFSAQLPAYLVAMGSALAFMLPIATPSAAIAYSSGYVEIRDMVKAGAALSIACMGTMISLGFLWWRLLGII